MCNKGSYPALGTRALISDSHNYHRTHSCMEQRPNSHTLGMLVPPPHTQLNVIDGSSSVTLCLRVWTIYLSVTLI